MGLFALAFASCQKDAPKPQPQAQTSAPVAHKMIPGTNYFVLELPDWECHDPHGNCIPYTKRGGRNPQVSQTINIINNGMPEEIKQNFIVNRAELITFIPSELVDGVINGDCTVEYGKMGNKANVDWLIFKDGDVVLDYLRMTTEP